MSKVKAVLDQIEAEQHQQTTDQIPDNIPLSELAGGERGGEAIPISTENVD